MRFCLKKQSDGIFVLATRKDHSHALEVTDPEYDTDGWWNRDLVVFALARFDDGDVQKLHYYPGRYGSISHCIFDFCDLLVRVGIITLAAKSIKPPVKVAQSAIYATMMTKGAVYSFRDANHMHSHFSDLTKYPNEGYYIGQELLFKGKLTRTDFA